MRTLALLAALTLTGSLVADDKKDKKDEKIDAAKLVGKWKVTKGGLDVPPGATAVVEFTKAGEIKVTTTARQVKVENTQDGTYKVNGSKLETSMKLTGTTEELKETRDITKLTDTTLHTKNKIGMTFEYERVKEEKKEEKKDK